jgi:hypothetical protein
MAPFSSKKSLSLVATSKHKIKFCKADYDERLNQNIQLAVDHILKMHRGNNTESEFSHGIFSGMYQITITRENPAKEFKISLTCHLDPSTEYTRKPKFFRHGEMGKYLQVGYNESYLTVERRTQMRDAVIALIDRMKDSLLEEFHLSCIILSFGQSFRACGVKPIPTWVYARPALFAPYLSLQIYGSIPITVVVECCDETGSKTEDRYLHFFLEKAHEHDIGSLFALVREHEQTSGFSLENITLKNGWGRKNIRPLLENQLHREDHIELLWDTPLTGEALFNAMSDRILNPNTQKYHHYLMFKIAAYVSFDVK